MAWDDSAPTPQELAKAAPTGNWDDAAPTAAELSSASPEDAGKADALAKGLGKGVTLGFAPEILAGVKAISTKGWDKQAYYDELAKQQAAFRGAEANHPWISAGGNIAGSLPLMALSGGLGAAGEGAGVLARLGNAAKVGAGLGALQGFSDSDAQVLNGDIGQAAWDTTKGAAIGAAGGAIADAGMQAVGGLVNAGKAIGNELLDTKTGNALKDSYNFGKEGIKVVGEKAREAAQDNATAVGEKLAGSIEDVRSQIGKKIGTAIQALEQSDQTVDLEPIIEKIQPQIDKLSESSLPEMQRDAQKLRDLLESVVKSKIDSSEGTLTPSIVDANQLKRDFSALGPKGPSSLLQTQDAQNVASQAAGGLKSAIDNSSTGLQEVNEEYSATKKLQQLLGLKPQDYYTNPGTGEETLAPGALNKMLDLVRGASGDGAAAVKKQELLDQVNPILNFLSKVNPELGDLSEEISSASKRLKLSHSAQKTGLYNQLSGTPEAIATRAGNYAGLAVNSIPEGITNAFSKVGSMTGGVAQAIQNGDQKSLNYLISIGKNRYPKLTEKLTEAVNSNFDQSRRNALVFSLLQDPNYRQQMHDLGTGVKNMFSSDNNNGDVK